MSNFQLTQIQATGKNTARVLQIIQTTLLSLPTEEIQEVSINGYQECGEYAGDLVFPIITIKFKEAVK